MNSHGFQQSMSRLKVLILTSSFLPTVGGLQYELKWFLDNLDRRLSNDGGTEAYFVYSNDRSEPYACFRNIATFDLGLKDFRKASVGRMIMRLGKFLRKVRPEVVHCHGILPDGLWVLVASRIFRVRTSIVVTSHGQDIVSLPRWSYGDRTRRSQFLVKYVANRIAMHVLPSEAMIGHAVRIGTPENNTVVIPHGIPLEDDYDFERDFPTSAPGPGSGRVKMNLGGGFNILSLSSAREIKNLAVLIEAFSRVRDKIADSRLLLACHGPSAERIVRLVGEKGLKQQVVFIGEVVGLAKERYFQASQVYCSVSHFESFGITLLEAMKHGAAVVASRVGGVPEFIEDGKNGLLTSPTDVDEIASALLRIHGDESLRKRLVENGKKTVRGHSISRAIDEHMALYRRLASQTAGQG